MDLLSASILFVAGCVAGFLSGFFGVGGGIVLVPMLLYFFQNNGVSSLVATHLTFGTSLMIIVIASFSSAVQYYRDNHIIWRAVLFVGLSGVIGAWGGTAIAAAMEGKSLQRIFAGVAVLAALRLLGETRKPRSDAGPNTGVAGLSVTGFLAGAVSSMTGVGGDVFAMPILYSILRFPLKKSLGISSAAMAITALVAAAGYAVRGIGNELLPANALGYVDYIHAAPVIIGMLPLAYLGASMANGARVTRLRKVFAVLLFIVAVKMLFF
jgi:uncharacterized membrane protein YfcA